MEEDEEKKPKPLQQPCFNCLDRRLKSDFSNQLLFSYGVSDSPLPSSSSAVVQMSNSGGETCSASQFVLVYLPSDEHEHEHDCFIEYVNEYGLETNGGSNNQDPAKIGVGIVDEQPASLDSLSNGGRKTPLDGIGFKASTCNCAGRDSCLRTMTALYLIARIGICSYSIFEEIASDFLSGGLEDHILCSLSLLIERKASGRDSVNFLRLLGIPS
ncbi:hypothetical protein EZV62_018727 [Acer yangbiense]|uniref:Uncharacterized protein n=1 Tax=Acer yangbiense TaxID=1000413 RepID=A0A5C7HKI8_9ROSI|nr:hypothetical protein EZV62_018727 [Acer yangbiense]